MGQSVLNTDGIAKIPGGVGGADGLNRISAGTQIAGTLATVLFANSNGITFGMSNSSIVTASLNSTSNVGLNTAATAVTWTVNSGGISFDAGAYLTTAALSNHSHGNPQLNLTNLSGTTASNSAGLTLSLSAAAPGGGGAALSAGTQSVSTGTVVFANSHGVSFGMSNSNQITASVNSTSNVGLNTAATQVTWTVNSGGISLNASAYLTTAMASNAVTLSNIRVSAGTTSNVLSSIYFSNANGVSFQINGSTMSGSVRQDWISSQTNQQLTMYATGNTTQSSTGTSNASSLVFRGEGVASVGITGGSIVVSVPAGAPSPVNFSAGTTSGNLGSVVFSNSNGVSFGLNGSTITASAGGGAGATLSGSDPFNGNEFLAIAGGNASLWINAFELPAAVQFDRFGIRMTHSNATNSSGSATISAWVGFYTRNDSSLSSYASTSFTTAITASGTVGSYSLFGGIKILPIPWTTTITAGNYWVGVLTRTTTGGTNMSFGNLGISQLASTFSGYFGSASNDTNGMRLGHGVYSVTTAGFPTAISLTQINARSSAFHRHPAWLLMTNIF